MTEFSGIKKIFTDAAETYDRANKVLTFGLDTHWRKTAAKHASSFGGSVWLDVCCGTGDMAVALKKQATDNVQVFAADFCPAMLEVAKKKASGLGVQFITTDSADLPFENNSVDIITISFATRNLNTSTKALTGYFQEFYRVLKPGGKFINLETTRPEKGMIKKILYTYAGYLVAPLGFLVSKTKKPYRYLSHTIRNFYTAEELREILLNAGFKEVDYFYQTLGLVAVHTALK